MGKIVDQYRDEKWVVSPYRGEKPQRQWGRQNCKRACEHCQRKFYRRMSGIRYCSRECARNALNLRRREKRQQARRSRHGKCEVCHTGLPNTETGRSTRRYCSNECRQWAYRRRLAGRSCTMPGARD
jgi:hypothetical protein